MLVAFAQLVAYEMLNAPRAKPVLKANALILVRFYNVDQTPYVKHLATELSAYVQRDSNVTLERVDAEKRNARETQIAQKTDDVTTMDYVSTHVNKLAFVEEMLNVVQETTDLSARVQLVLLEIRLSDVSEIEMNANPTHVDKTLVVLILWVRTNANVTPDVLETLNLDVSAHQSLPLTLVKERGAEPMHNVGPETVKANVIAQKSSPMEILIPVVQRKILVSFFNLLFFCNNKIL